MTDGLNHLIAGGPPRIDFSPLTSLLDAYTAGKKARRDSDIMDAFKAGLPTRQDGSPDFDQISKKLYSLGDLERATSLAQLGQKQRESDLSAEAVRNANKYLFGQQGQQGATAAQTTLQTGAQPRGIRNNNPLNIEAGSFTSGQPGFTGSDGRYAKFETPEHGLAAADKLLVSYASKGINTIGGIVNRWAPPGDNNPTSTYAGFVAKELGVDPDQNINMADPILRRKIALTMAKFENGREVQTAQQGGQPTGLQAAAVFANPYLPASYQQFGLKLAQSALEPKHQQVTDAQGNVWDVAPNGQRTLSLKSPDKSEIRTVKDAQGNEMLVRIGADGSSKRIDTGNEAAPSNPYAYSGKMSETQSKDALYASRMFNAENVLSDPRVVDAARSPAQSAMNMVPGGNYLVSEAYQKYDQAQRDFVNAVLRRESGAVISDAEFANARKQYFPQPGDTPAILEQKRRNRHEAIKGFAAGAGPSYQPPMLFGDGGRLVTNQRSRADNVAPGVDQDAIAEARRRGLIP